MNLHDSTGRHIGVYPYQHLTISGVAFEGVYLKHFFPENIVMMVPRPSEHNYSVKQILWLEYEMNRTGTFIQYARNGGEVRLTVVGGRVVEVDGYCAETNTVYEFDGCFYHGCPCC